MNNPQTPDEHTTSSPCSLCKEKKPAQQMFPLDLVRPALANYIRSCNPELEEDGAICLDCLNRMRSDYILSLITEETGALSHLEEETAKAVQENDLASRNIEGMFQDKATFGERVADNVASFGGSWKFIILFGTILIAWMFVNVSFLGHPFDPYPFILLNLVLSTLAALQAPVIMMSQNRQETKDRLRGENDYRVNLKAELEIRHLHDKLDLLLHNQWEKLMEIQAVQTDMMQEFIQKKEKE
ncbi:MAG: DUF1003 domain-containing protein [Candidatus Kapaibacterium sp.]